MLLRSLPLPKTKGQKEEMAYPEYGNLKSKPPPRGLSASMGTGRRGVRNTLVSIREEAGVLSVTDTCEHGDWTTRERAVPSLGTVCEVPCAALPPKALQHVTFSGARGSGTWTWPWLSCQNPPPHPALVPWQTQTGRGVKGGHGTEREGLNVGKQTAHGRPRRGPATDAGRLARCGHPRVPPALALPTPPPPIWTA